MEDGADALLGAPHQEVVEGVGGVVDVGGRQPQLRVAEAVGADGHGRVVGHEGGAAHGGEEALPPGPVALGRVGEEQVLHLAGEVGVGGAHGPGR